MQDNFNRSLLKGTAELPLDNLAGLDEASFDRLSSVDKFLVNDTLLTYATETARYPYELYAAGDEKFAWAPAATSGLPERLGHDDFEAAIPLLLQLHIRHKVLFRPALIIHVFDHRTLWEEYLPYLVRVIRERGRWLSSAKAEWSWWKTALDSNTWQEKGNAERYLYFRLIRHYRKEEAARLLRSMWQEEAPESKKVLLTLIRENLHAVDTPLLTELWAEEALLLKEEIRKLIFLAGAHPEVQSFIARLPDIVKDFVSWKDHAADLPFVRDLYANTGMKEWPVEWLFFLDPSQLFSPPLNKWLDKPGKNKARIDDLLFGALYKNDRDQLCGLVSKVWEEQPSYRLGSSWIIYFNNLPESVKNELILHLIHTSPGRAVWDFLCHVLTNCLIVMDKKSSGALVSLARENSEAAGNKALPEAIMKRFCFILHPDFLGDWSDLCETVIFNDRSLNYKRLTARIHELITFRNKLESDFHEASR